MSRSDTVPKIPRSAELTLQKLIRMWSNGYTGRIELLCNRGGVVTMTTGETWRPEDGDPSKS